jgi:ferric-dicitrate binding protein FerR (iron transport regulator)
LETEGNTRAKNRKRGRKQQFFTRYATPIRLAAGVAVVAWLGLMAAVLVKHTQRQQVLLASTTSTREQQLRDGSTVFMNRHTILSVVGSYNHKHRKLHIEGEAWFEVAPGEDAPFEVDAGGVVVTGKQTSFNVRAQTWSDSVVVYITDGTVELRAKHLKLRAASGQSALFVRSKRMLTIMPQTDRNVLAYKTKYFYFRNEPLQRVIHSLNEVYGALFVLKPGAPHSCPVTAEFRNDAPETIAAMLASITHGSTDPVNGRYLIHAERCDPIPLPTP